MRPPTIYRNFIKNYAIETFESTITIHKNIETIKFLAINITTKEYKHKVKTT